MASARNRTEGCEAREGYARARLGTAVLGVVCAGVLVLSGCRGQDAQGPVPGSAPAGGGPAASDHAVTPKEKTPVAGTGAAEGPAGQTASTISGDPETLAKALAEFHRGAARLEQYDYVKAAQTFAQVVEMVPGWTAAQFNLALAYYNMEGKDGSLDKARKICEDILASNPNHLHANFLLGMYYQHLGKMDQAVEHYRKVHAADPDDVYVGYKYAEVLSNLGRNDEATALLQQVVDRDPGFASSHYRLFSLYQRSRQREKAVPLLERFKALSDAELDGKAFTVGNQYSSSGKYYLALGPEGFPVPRPESPGPRILFSPEVRTLDAPMKPWKWQGGQIGLPGIAVGDLDGDGDLDLVLCGLNDNGTAAVWLNDGKGGFSRGESLADRVTSPCLGDVDNDGDLDLWLGRAGDDLLLLNDGKGKFAAPKTPVAAAEPHLTSCARLIDLDCDGDLDLLALRFASGSIPATGDAKPAASKLYNNNRDGTYPEVAAKSGVALPETALAAVVYDDLDGDRDLDLMFFPAGKPPIAWVNDRVGRFHLAEAGPMGVAASGAVGATTGDPNKDSRRDLLIFTGGEVHLYLNRGGWKFEPDKDFAARWTRLGGTSGQFADMDNDGDLDLVIADAHRRDGSRGPVLLLNDWPNARFLDAAEVDRGNLLAAIKTKGDAICVIADGNNDGKCDLFLAEMNESPKWIENTTQGGRHLALDLVGTEERGKKSRSNYSAIGARVEVKSGTVVEQFTVGTPSGATAMPPLRVHFGLGPNPDVQWLRILWPDAVLQAELDLAAGRVEKLTEIERKPSSCPHLFAWNGSRFEFISDFGGMGGLGYLVAPGQYAPPDPTEYLPIPRLEPQSGDYVLQVLEPLEEVVYFDEAKLLAIDHPEGTEVYPNEMMAVSVPPPEFEVFCVREPIEPIRAIDHRGQDVTEALRHVDRCYAGATEPDHRFHGFAKEHAVELDFGDRLASARSSARGRGLSSAPSARPEISPEGRRGPGVWGEGGRLVLVLNGWVEYGYSSTNYAAAQAGLHLKAPSVEVFRDGRWVELFHEVGYPAGLQHWMTLDLSGKVLPTDRRFRISSNMELYWDRAFLAVAFGAPATVQEVAAHRADLHCFGYPREYSPDGRRPNLYDYSNVDRYVPWKRMPGLYTRFGDVTELLSKPDDGFVIMGPGEELTLRFPAAALAPVPPGHRRSFLLKTDSYCKDMDLYTACGDTVEPLPFHAMRGYPYPSDQRYPDTDATRRYRRTYNTRQVLDR